VRTSGNHFVPQDRFQRTNRPNLVTVQAVRGSLASMTANTPQPTTAQADLVFMNPKKEKDA